MNEKIKDLSFKLGLFTIAVILGFYSANLAFKEIFETRLGLYKKQIDFITKQANKESVLYLGDSRVAMGIKNRFLPDNHLNLGFPNSNLRDQFIKLRWYEQNHTNVKYLVLQNDHHVLSSYRNKTNHIRRAVYVSDAETIKSIYDINTLELFFYRMTSKFPLLLEKDRSNFSKGLIERMITYFTNTEAVPIFDFDRFGDVNYSRVKYWSKNPKDYRKRKADERYSHQFNKSKITDELVNVLDRIFEFSQQNKIQVILVRYPVTKEYGELVNQLNMEKFNRHFNHPVVKERLNFTDLYQDQPEMFQNIDHLNYSAARVFSKKLSRQINQLIDKNEKR